MCHCSSADTQGCRNQRLLNDRDLERLIDLIDAGAQNIVCRLTELSFELLLFRRLLLVNAIHQTAKLSSKSLKGILVLANFQNGAKVNIPNSRDIVTNEIYRNPLRPVGGLCQVA